MLKKGFIMLRTLRYYSKRPSNIKTKLEHFIETGQVLRQTPSESKPQTKSKLSSYNSQKALQALRNKYDTAIFQSSTGKTIDTNRLTRDDMNVASSKSLDIFKTLMEIKKIKKRPIDQRLLLHLLGTNTDQIKDPFLVTKDTLKLLEKDSEPTRAEQLARLAGPKAGQAAMNSILQWHLERGNVKEAFKCFNDRKKWGIPADQYTYVTLFSGVAKCHEWGTVTDTMAQKCIDIFESFRTEAAELRIIRKASKTPRTKTLECTTEHFNACLTVLVKNFSRQQLFAWSFFDTMTPAPGSKRTTIIPDSQTFSILLNGVKRCHQTLNNKILENSTLSSSQRLLQLLQSQKVLTDTAEMVLAKVIKAATPPVPPTKEEAEKDPELLVTYREKIRRRLVDIDAVFATTFITCFINRTSGTSVSANLGSHYRYVVKGLDYLCAWCPEVESMFHFIERAQITNLTEPSEEVKRRTDARVAKALEGVSAASELAPDNIESVDKTKINPTVIFPPPLFSRRKSKAIFSGRTKRLVDFTRPKMSDMYLLQLDKSYRDSGGKYGKKLPPSFKISLDKKKGINKFLLMVAMDALLALGKHKEYYLALWYILTKWGGIYVNRNDIAKSIHDHGMSHLLAENHYVDFIPQESETPEDASLSQKIDVTDPHDEEVVDIMLVENFMYQIQDFDGRLPPSRLLNEIFTVMLNPKTNLSGTLKPRDRSMSHMFAVFTKELHYFNDINHTKISVANHMKRVPDNSPRKSITKEQLELFLTSLTRFINLLLVHDHKVYTGPRKSVMPNVHVESYNKIIDRICTSAWLGVQKDSEDAIRVHKLIVKSGILMYKPAPLVDPRQKVVYSHIKDSLSKVYEYLSQREDLGKSDKKLMLNIRSLYQLKSDTKEAEEKLKAYIKNIYWSID